MIKLCTFFSAVNIACFFEADSFAMASFSLIVGLAHLYFAVTMSLEADRQADAELED